MTLSGAVSGAEALFRSLVEEGVEVIFGYPGGQVLPIYDALPSFPIRHVLTRHEQGAVHAADGYARATGRPGVCLATSGPGAANLVTGLATAYMDSTPVVAFSGQVPTALLGRDAFQEADLTGMTMPITKHNYLVREPSDLPRVVKEAFHIATTGRPGPVLVDVPRDVQTGRLTFAYPTGVRLPGYRPADRGDPARIAEAAAALRGAARPVVIAGGGVIASGASGLLRELAGRLATPVASTLLGLGSFPADDPLFLGLLGMHGTYAANRAVHEADIILAVGTRFADRATGPPDSFAAGARIIHVDIDPAEIDKNIPAAIPVIGDAGRVLEAILEEVVGLVGVAGAAGATGSPAAAGREAWLSRIRGWAADARTPTAGETAPAAGIDPAAVIRVLAALAGDEAVVVTDVGQHQMWTALNWPFRRPRTLITSGGLGTMGFGLPAAIGAKVGRPGAPVILVTGDGSFQMTVQELGTLAAEGLAVKIILFNNSSLGMVRQWQELFHGGRLSEVDLGSRPDFPKLADAYGLKAVRLRDGRRLERALEEAMADPGSVLVELAIDPTAKVYPMVPPGKSTMEMLLGPG